MALNKRQRKVTSRRRTFVAAPTGFCGTSETAGNTYESVKILVESNAGPPELNFTLSKR